MPIISLTGLAFRRLFHTETRPADASDNTNAPHATGGRPIWIYGIAVSLVLISTAAAGTWLRVQGTTPGTLPAAHGTLRVVADPETGCEYVTIGYGLTPRLSASGGPMGCRDL